eukprot:scaffold1541_cov121-Skeletonema_dohrnii-CCMP3373.AAC.5
MQHQFPTRNKLQSYYERLKRRRNPSDVISLDTYLDDGNSETADCPNDDLAKLLATDPITEVGGREKKMRVGDTRH